MKIRQIKKLLQEDNGYIWQLGEYKNGPALCIGSGYVGDLISIPLTRPYKIILGMDKEKEKLNPDLRKIYDGLEALIQQESFQELMEGKDEVTNGVPVFYIEKGQLIESVTEEVSWRNITANGDLIYDNTHFKTAKEALKYGIKDMGYALNSANERIAELKESLEKVEKRKESYIQQKKYLEKELKRIG